MPCEIQYYWRGKLGQIWQTKTNKLTSPKHHQYTRLVRKSIVAMNIIKLSINTSIDLGHNLLVTDFAFSKLFTHEIKKCPNSRKFIHTCKTF